MTLPVSSSIFFSAKQQCVTRISFSLDLELGKELEVGEGGDQSSP
jgi:hypothetical protein